MVEFAEGPAIGTRVRVTHIAKCEYRENNGRWKRTWFKELLHREGWYTGYTYKWEGYYTEVSSVMPWDGGQPFLSDLRSVKLCRVKFHKRGNDQFCFPEGVEVLDVP